MIVLKIFQKKELGIFDPTKIYYNWWGWDFWDIVQDNPEYSLQQNSICYQIMFFNCILCLIRLYYTVRPISFKTVALERTKKLQNIFRQIFYF